MTYAALIRRANRQFTLARNHTGERALFHARIGCALLVWAWRAES